MAYRPAFITFVVSLILSTAALAQSAAVQQNALQRQAIIDAYRQGGALVEERPDSVLITPASSIVRPEDAGLRMHTNTKILLPKDDKRPHAINPATNQPPFSGYPNETPSSLACIYKLVAQSHGCDPNTFHTNTTGGSKAIAIVDAFDAPRARPDLNHYSAQFGLPLVTQQNFVVWYCGTTLASCNRNLATRPTCTSSPSICQGWEGEITLDVQIAHAMAPKAKLFLVEANSDSNADLFVAVQKASALVVAAGGGQVSMSWGGSEFPTESINDINMTTTKVTYYASTGDTPGTEYPSVSQNVVAVGGTTVLRNNNTFAFVREDAWADAGQGLSRYIPRPTWQNSIAAIVKTKRGVPDVSAIANPDTGVWIYVSTQGGWLIFGGTSVASPLFAGIVNNAGRFRTTTTAEHNLIYARMGTPSYYDVVNGRCGPTHHTAAKAGWDFCTGIGSPRGRAGE